MQKILIQALIVFCFQAQAQQTQKKENHPIKLRISYLGSIIHLGFKTGIEYPVRVKEILRPTDSIAIEKVQSISVNIGFYYHKNFHFNNFFTVGYLWRRTNRHGWFADVEPQIGFSRTFIDGTTYIVNEANEVNNKSLAGDWFALTKLSFSIGKTLNNTKHFKWPMQIYARPSFLLLFPYNNFFYLRPSIEVGTIFIIKNKNTKTFTKTIQK